jgi:hypothetical protein
MVTYSSIAVLLLLGAWLLSPGRSIRRLFAETPTVWHISILVYVAGANILVLRQPWLTLPGIVARLTVSVMLVAQAIFGLALAYVLFYRWLKAKRK